MVDKFTEKLLEDYYDQANKLSTWFNAGHMNFVVAELLLKNYNSSSKRQRLQAEEYAQPEGPKKKRRINYYYTVLHKYILMFCGLALECYLKGLLIKTRKLEPLTPDRKSLSAKCLQHLNINMFCDTIGNPTTKERDTILRLRRAIDAGKYPIEKKITKITAYTAYLDSDIKETKSMINKAKQKW